MKTLKHCSLAAALMLASQLSAQEIITIHDPAFNQDEVFELPEGMAVSEDSLLNDWQAKNYLYPDTTCENPNYNPTYDSEVYRDRLLRLPTVIEMTYNDVVQGFIDRYTNRQRRAVAAMLGTANLYVPLFEEALDYYGLPLELKYLPVIESALNPKAVSPAGAAGLWQFMVATGKRYDLDVNSRVDERKDPNKSTWAAARFLRDLFKIYGDWHLVLAAYNCGPGNVNKAIHRAGGQRDYWQIYPYLPKETRGYVPAFIAANYIMNYYCDHNICPMRTRYPIQTDTVMVSKNVDMRQVAELCNIDLDIVKTLNPQYKTNVIPGYSTLSSLRLPQEQIVKFIELKDTIYGEAGQNYVRNNASQEILVQTAADKPHVEQPIVSQPATQPVTTTVRTYGRNSQRNTTKTASTAASTKNATTVSTSKSGKSKTAATAKETTAKTKGTTSSKNKVAATTKETSKTKGKTASSKTEKTSTKTKSGKNTKQTASSKSSATKEQTIQKGETLTQIAKKNGTTVEKLKKLNNMKGDQIQQGKKIRVK